MFPGKSAENLYLWLDAGEHRLQSVVRVRDDPVLVVIECPQAFHVPSYAEICASEPRSHIGRSLHPPVLHPFAQDTPVLEHTIRRKPRWNSPCPFRSYCWQMRGVHGRPRCQDCRSDNALQLSFGETGSAGPDMFSVLPQGRTGRLRPHHISWSNVPWTSLHPLEPRYRPDRTPYLSASCFSICLSSMYSEMTYVRHILPKNWRPQSLHLYCCFLPLRPVLTTLESAEQAFILPYQW